MDISILYTKIQSHLDQQLPFVVYRKSGENQLYSFLQKDRVLYKGMSYTHSGFIFAPFDSNNTSILIPTEKSDCYKALIPSLKEEQSSNQTKRSYLTEDKNAKTKHIQLVNDGIKAIEKKAFKKVVLSRKEEVEFTENDILKKFQQLIKNYPNAFVYYWYHPDIGSWLGATPETLLSIRGNMFFTMALAGTQPYVNSMDVDWGTKEIEEQAMVTDFVLKELSSKVDQIAKSNTYTHKAGSLLHLRTDITGIINDNNSNIQDILKILHPTPAVCGLPKKEARSFILEREQYNRKYYTGFLGELNMDKKGKKESNLFVNLRCMEIVQNKAVLYVGGGITKDSIPEAEWKETVRKTETMKNILE